MKKFLILISFCTIIYGREPDVAFHEECLYPTVMITKGDDTLGTGFIFSSQKIENGQYLNKVLTCFHVIKQPNLAKLLNFPNKVTIKKGNYKNWSYLESITDYECDVVMSNPESDMSVLSFKTPEKMFCVRLNFDPELFINDEIFHIGCGVGEFSKSDYGKITALNSKYGDTKDSKYVRTSVPTCRGDSGGPNFIKNGDHYECVGITCAVKSLTLQRQIPLPEGFLKIPETLMFFHISYICLFKEMEDELK